MVSPPRRENQYADRICLFCQAGRIHVPRAYQPLLTNLENSIIGVAPPNGSSFHAKVWFLRYLCDDDTVTYRLLCLSRNMTFDRSWDTMLSLEGKLRERTLVFKRNHPLGEFVEALPTMADRKLTTIWKQRLDQLAHEILVAAQSISQNSFDQQRTLASAVDLRPNDSELLSLQRLAIRHGQMSLGSRRQVEVLLPGSWSVYQKHGASRKWTEVTKTPGHVWIDPEQIYQLDADSSAIP
jgi:hypothetical protein